MRSIFCAASVIAVVAAFPPVGARAGTTSCSIPQPCAVFANNSGIAVLGESAGADGVLGEASSGTIYGAGIEGESLKQTGADAAGTFGLTLLSSGVAPNYGVVAYGSLYGVYGQAGNTGLSETGPGYGVFGQDNAGSKNGDYNVGVTGLSKNNVGVLAEGGGSPTSPIYGSGIPIGLYAVAKASNGNSQDASVGIVAESDSSPEIVINTKKLYTINVADSQDLLYGVKEGCCTTFVFDYSGNELLSGELTTSHGGPYLRTTGASGTTVTAYSEHATMPEMADVGEAQLVNGRAVVRIDAALADVIDVRPGYHVFLTPDGDCNGLYVESRTPSGFVVRELRGGRSTLAFEYRIVAKPREENGTRLARVTGVAPTVEFPGAGRGSSQQIPLPLSPEERLKRKIGARAYAEIMTALTNRFASLPSR